MQLPRVSEKTRDSIFYRLANDPDSMGAPLRDQVIEENEILAALLLHFSNDFPEPELALMAAWLTYEAFSMEFKAQEKLVPEITSAVILRALAPWKLPIGDQKKLAAIRAYAEDFAKELNHTNPELIRIIKRVTDIHLVPQGAMWLAILVYCCMQEACKESG